MGGIHWLILHRHTISVHLEIISNALAVELSSQRDEHVTHMIHILELCGIRQWNMCNIDGL